MTTADVARLRGRTPALVRHDARAGVLPVAAVTPGGVRLFRRSDVEEYVRQRGGGVVVDASRD